MVASNVAVLMATQSLLMVLVKTLMSVQLTLAPLVILVSTLPVVGVVLAEPLGTFGIQMLAFVKTTTSVLLVSARLPQIASTLMVHTHAPVRMDIWTRMAMDTFASGPSTPSTTLGCRPSLLPTCTSSHMIPTRTAPTVT